VSVDASTLARNMSVMPRSTLNFTRLRPERNGTGDPVTDGAGMKFLCRLKTDAFTPKRYRQRRHREGNWEAFSLEDRIRIAYPRVRSEVEGRKTTSAKAIRRAIDAPVELLADELRDIAASIPMATLALPAFGMFMPPHNTARVEEGSLIRTIAILGRRRGGIFLRDVDPIVWTAMDGELRDLWTPIDPDGSKQ
jgi:hypothetical protein